MCSGRDVNFPILGGLMVREEYAEQNTDIVKKILAAYLRGVTYMQNAADVEAVLEVSRAFHVWADVPVTETALKEDLILRPLYNLDQQLDSMNRNFANNYESELDKHYIGLEDFLFNHNVITTKYLPKEYVTDEYMKLVSEDPELRSYSYFGAIGDDASATLSTQNSEDGKLEGVVIAGIVLCVLGVVSLFVAIIVFCKARSQKQPTFNPPTESVEKV